MRLHRADLGAVVARHLLEGLVRRVLAVEPPRLQPVDRPLRADLQGEVAQVKHVAEHAGAEEERRARRVRPHLHRHHVQPFRGCRHRRSGRRGLRAGVASGRRRIRPVAEQSREGSDGGRLEQHRDRQVGREALAHLAQQPHGDERVAADLEEVVLDPDPGDAEKLRPEAHQRPLRLGARREIGRLALGPLEQRGARGGLGRRGGGAGAQCREIHRADDDLRPPGPQRS